MEVIRHLIIILSLIIIVSSRVKFYRPCLGSDIILARYQENFENFDVYFNEYFDVGTNITLSSTSNAYFVVDEETARITMKKNRKTGNMYAQLVILKNVSSLKVTIHNNAEPKISLTSALINGREYCETPVYYTGEQLSCGQRKVKYNQLITHGESARAGDWPWHVALSSLTNSIFKYICGGSLISVSYVLTAAHCVTKNGETVLPESLGIILGKTDLIGGGPDTQEREVFKIIAHENFVYKKLHNDIALLKLSTKVVFTDYVQPICFWYDEDKTSPPDGMGTVVGWGFDQSGFLSPSLRTATIPAVSDITCIRKKPTFYSQFLNGKKFCAGHLNGTSVCNGDSGGGFVVSTSSKSNIAKSSDGVWYIRGIISLAFRKENDNTCDPNEYVLFTDVAKYVSWIKENMK